MAPTVSSLGGTASAATGTSRSLTLGAAAAVGDKVVVVVAIDNTGASGAAPTSLTLTDSKAHAWGSPTVTRLVDPGAASAGAYLAVWHITASVALTTSDTVTVTTGATAAIGIVAAKVTPSAGKVLTVGTSGSSSTTAGTTATVTTGSLAVDELVFGFGAVERSAAPTGDSDTTNGSWSSLVSGRGGNSGTSTSNQYAFLQWKQVTGTGAQAYNVSWTTNTDACIGYLTFTETTASTITDPGDLSWVALGWADDPGASPPSDGGAISSWYDGSGNGYTFGVAGGKEPTYRAAASDLNGLAAWDCDGTEGLQSGVYSSTGPCSLVAIAYIDPTQPNATGWLVSGYDTNVRLTNAGKVVVNSWGGTSDTATDDVDHRGEIVLVAVNFNGASSRWRIVSASGDTSGVVNLSAGNNHTTRVTAAAWDGNVSSGDTTKGKFGLVGAYSGDILADSLFPALVSWFDGEYLTSPSTAVDPVGATAATGPATATVTATAEVDPTGGMANSSSATAAVAATAEVAGSASSAATSAATASVTASATITAPGASAATTVSTASVSATAEVVPTGATATASSATAAVTATAEVDPVAASAASSSGTANVVPAVPIDPVGAVAATATGTANVSGTANVFATGVVSASATATANISGTADVSATGAVSASSTATAAVSAQADVFATGAASATATGTADVSGAVQIDPTGAACSSATGTVNVSGQADLSATGAVSVSATGTADISTALVVDPTGAVVVAVCAAADVTGQADIAPTGAVSASVSGTGQITATANVDPSGAVVVTSTATAAVSATADIVPVGVVGNTVTSTAAISAQADINPTGGVSLAVCGTADIAEVLLVAVTAWVSVAGSGLTISGASSAGLTLDPVSGSGLVVSGVSSTGLSLDAVAGSGLEVH